MEPPNGPNHISRMIEAAVLAKGAIIATVLAALEIPFLQSLIIATVSAIVTGSFVLAAAIISTRAVHRNTEQVKEVVAVETDKAIEAATTPGPRGPKGDQGKRGEHG
jgi:hypothetical protein